jgi:hypothetical protein
MKLKSIVCDRYCDIFKKGGFGSSAIEKFTSIKESA